MPGWHEIVKDAVDSNELVLLGVTQEQHAERCRLFAQWKGFGWPILHDPINLLGSSAVPIVVAIDEHGIVRSTNPKADWLLDTFLKEPYSAGGDAPEAKQPKAKQPELTSLQALAKSEDSAEAYRKLGDAAILWHRADPDLAVDAYNSALQRDDSGINHFRLGVALRRRHDTASRQQSDFARAVSHWTAALSKDPNQYIWRRRIQQYGPRLAKPYPFYDWVQQAVHEIRSRGEQPIELKVRLSGAEIARPSKQFQAQVRADQTSPDPQNLVFRDTKEQVRMNIAVAPSQVMPGESIRVHLEFEVTRDVRWNNEAEPLTVWIDDVEGWTPQHRLVQHEDPPRAAESDEVRKIEIEFQSSAQAAPKRLTGFALYYICDKATGTCTFRRQDFAFQANVR